MKEKQHSGKGRTQVGAWPEPPKIIELRSNIYQFCSEKPGSHIYLIKGDAKNVLIDAGIASTFPLLKSRLSELGLRVRDINLILLTHEHFDHTGSTAFFHSTTVVAAHRLAANKLELQDDFVTFNRYFNAPSKPFWVDIWLEDGTAIDLGKYKLRVIHTPGHTSGCICLYEPSEGLLFTGDTLLAGGTLSHMTASGNMSDYMNSIQRLNSLKIREIYPGHGRLSNTPDEDLAKAVVYAQTLFEDTKMFFEAFIKTRELEEKSGYWREAQQSPG